MSNFRSRVVSAATAALTAGLLVLIPSTANAYETDGLMFYYDFRNLYQTNTSVANGTSLADLSGNNRNGTVAGSGSGLTYNATTQALEFPGGSNGTAYVSLAGSFSDFSQGISIEFEGEFGAQRSAWERIFDFGIPGGLADDFWIGQMDTSNELALETWISGVNQGRCHTDTGGTALGAVGARTFAKWVITVGNEGGTTKCRIYKDGVELPTRIQNGFGVELGTAVVSGGSAYPLPAVSNRTTNFLGRSNWTADNDLEGSIRYLRLYNQALSPQEVLDNATSSQTPTQQLPAEEPTAEPSLAQTGSGSGSWAPLLAAGALTAGAFALIARRRRT